MSDYDFEDEDLNLDDFDDLFDDDFESMDVDEDSRTPIEAFGEGAIDSLKDTTNQAAIAKILAQNALPDGYTLAAGRLGSAIDSGRSLYDDARKAIKGPINSIKKDLADALKNVEEKSILGMDVDKIRDMLKTEDDDPKSNATSMSQDDVAIQATLNSIFERTEAAESNAIAQAESTRQAKADGSSLSELRRLTSFQDTIQIDWMRKTLELQQRDYFVNRESLAIMKAFATDTKGGLEAIAKNTSLPDIVKDSLTEAYGQQVQERLFGKTIETASDYFSNFGGNLMENVRSRVMSAVGDLTEALEAGQEITSALGMADDIRNEELAGSLAGSLGAEWAAERIGGYLKKFIAKNPRIAEVGADLAFYAENYPTELVDALDTWDGQFFNQKAIERFPFLERVQSTFLADELRGLVPRMQELRVGINQNLAGTGATDIQNFDEITRRSIIEIIPGYLSRILEQMTIQNFGPEAERIVFDINSESFTTERQAAQNALNSITNSSAMLREQNAKEVSKLFNKGRFMDESRTDEFIEYLQDARNRGVDLSAEGIENDLLGRSDDSSQRIQALITKSGKEGMMLERALGQIASNEDADLKKQMLVKDAVRRLTGGKRLSPEAQLALENWVTDYGILGLRPKKENVADDLAKKDVSANAINEIVAMFNDTELQPRQVDTIIARLGRDVGDTIGSFQESINRFYAAGQKDLLDRMGLTNFSSRGVNEIDQNITRDFDLNMDDDRSGFQQRTNAAVGGPVGPSVSADSNDFWNAFSIERDGLQGVPVHIMTDFFGKDVEADMTGPNPMLGAMEQMHGLVERGFTTTAELLDLLYQKDLEVNIEPQPGFIRSLIQSGEGIGSAGLNFLAAYTRGVFGMGNSLIGGAANIASSTINAGGNVLGSAFGFMSGHGKRDIYVAGNPEPVITVADLKAGVFTDLNTGKPVRRLKDITGPVVDVEGNQIIKASDWDLGVFDKEGTPLQGLTSMIGGGLDALGGVWMAQTKFALNVVKKVVTAPFTLINRMFDGPKDIYVKGETMPVLSAMLMKNGGYFSEVSGKPVRRPSDIDGPVRDAAGNIVLSNAQILEGLVDVHGNAVDANAAVMLAKKTLGLVGGTAKLAWDVTKFGFTAPIKLAGMGLDKFRAMRGGSGSEPSPDEVAAMSDGTVLQNILNFMVARWPLEGAVINQDLLQQQLAQLEALNGAGGPAGDADGDGDRDNSLADIIARRGTNQERPGDQGEIDRKSKEEGDGKDSLLMTIIAGIAGTLTTIGGFIPGIAATLGGMFALNKATAVVDGLGGDGIDAGDGERRKRGKRGGRRGPKIPKAGANVARSAATRGLGSVVASGVGKQVLKKGGVMAAGALAAGTIAAPVIAAAGTAWTIWELGNYIADRLDAEPLEKLRYMQYGIDSESNDHLAAIRQTEDVLMDHVRATRKGVELRMENSKIVEEFAELWGVDPSSQADKDTLIQWFNIRVIPVFTRHYGAAYQIDKNVDLLDIDDEMDESQFPRFLNFVKTYPRKNPMGFMVPVYPMITRLISKEEADVYLTGLLSKYQNVPSTEEDRMVSDGYIEKAMKEAAGEISKPMTTSDAYTAMAQAKMNRDVATKPVPQPSRTMSQQAKTDLSDLSNRTSGAGAGFRIIKPCKGRLTSPYGNRRVKGKLTFHRGVDWADYEGSPIVAAADGIVRRHGWSDSYGKVTYIEHENGWYTRYAHMHTLADLKVGDKISQGTMIGTMGNTGKSRGVHLHFEIRGGATNAYKTYDPLKYIVNGTKEAKEAKDEENAIRKEKKESMGDTIEGVNTIITNAGGDVGAMDVDTSKSPSKPPVNDKAIEIGQRNATNDTLGEISKVGTAQNTELGKQTKALTSIAKSQARMVELLELLVDKDPVTIGQPAEQPTSTGTVRQTPSPTNVNASPVIDLGRT
ncbi:tail fiber protein [Vibrio phage vB_VpaM_sm033]|nr:tail fiber protein [Vibrio phage vB_VpaM_sm033]